jgi:cytochrome b561
MISEPGAQRYAKLSMTLHWLMLGLFVGVYACIELKGMVPRTSPFKGLLLGMHGVFGLSIFALVWIRLFGRLKPAPSISPPLPVWQKVSSQVVHVALYALMIATPLLAWLMLSAGGKPIPYFGLFLPSPLSLDTELARQLKSWHEWVGNMGYWLIGLHAIAALFHHYVLGDNTLVRMLPGRRRRVSALKPIIK